MDPPVKKPPPRTLRQPSGKKPGGQKDYPAANLALVADPEHTVTMPLVGCCACGQSRAALPVEELAERRQVADLIARREVTEYRTVRGLCACGQVHGSAWPTGVEAPVQHGPAVAALTLYLTPDRQSPYQRTAELLAALAGIAVSPATLYAMGREAAVRVSAPVAVTAPALVRRAVMPLIPGCASPGHCSGCMWCARPPSPSARSTPSTGATPCSPSIPIRPW